MSELLKGPTHGCLVCMTNPVKCRTMEPPCMSVEMGFCVSGISSTMYINWHGRMLAEFAEIFQGLDLHISFILSYSFLILLYKSLNFLINLIKLSIIGRFLLLNCIKISWDLVLFRESTYSHSVYCYQ